ncbi:MAG: hypothetical protein DYH13_08150 [Alphaproteobacteria bacterium PRO2]|nr:hypothetical protein [Alphaproteobacteria bacterium PRO2]
MTIRSIRNRKSERGNVFFTLFGAVAIVGVLGAGIMATMRGPLSTMVNVNRRTQAEADMNIASKMVLLEATQDPINAGDCDLDGFVEPMPYLDAAGEDAPVGGGYLPTSVGSNKTDPWGTNYGYCAWDPGNETDADDCNGQNRLPGNGDGIGDANPDRYTIIAIISAGPDQEFDTTCTGGASPGVSKTAGSDDLWSTFSYETASAMGGGLWSIKQGEPDVAVIDKDIEAQGATFTGPVDLSGSASMFMPTDAVAGTCDSANVGIVRINTATNPDSLEVCDDANDGAPGGPYTWQSVAAGAAGISFWEQHATDTEKIFYDVLNGKVGIGVDDPAEALDVDGNVKLTEDILLATGSSITWGATGAHLSEATSILELAYGTAKINMGAATGIALTGNTTITGSGATDATNALVVSNSTPTSIFVVQNDGMVGVGVADPNDKLDVSGSIDVTDNYKLDGVNFLTDNGVTGTVLIGNTAGPDVTGVGNTVVGTSAAALLTTGINNTILGASAGEAVVSGGSNTIIGVGAGGTLGTGSSNILIGAAVDVPGAATSNFLNIGGTLYGDLANDRIGIGTSTMDDALEVNGNIDASGNIEGTIIHATDDVTAADDITAGGTVRADIFQLDGISQDFSDIEDCDDANDKIIWIAGTGWDCATDLQGGSGGGGQNLEEVLTIGNDAGGLDAVDFGGIAIGSGTLSTGGSQDLVLDVTGAAGADYFCDASGNNCFTASSVAGSGLWERNGTVVRTRSPAVYATDDFVFGAAQLADIAGVDDDARMFFDKSKGAFRAGYAPDVEWNDANVGQYSAAFGFGNIASGGLSMSWGGDPIVGLGNNSASGDSSTAWGFQTTASGLASTAWGLATSASGEYATAFGNNTTASGTNATAFGNEVRVGNGTPGTVGQRSVAIGFGDASGTRPQVTGTGSFGLFMGDQAGVDVTASSIMALLGGRLVIDPDDTSAANVNVSTGTQQLELDVEGDIGAINYCDQAGNNCFTAASVAGSGLWERVGTVVRTRNPAVYATDDFVFGAAQLDDIVGTDDDARMFFDKSKGAFRAGSAIGVQWDDAAVGANSASLGYSNWASGSASFAVGSANSASGANSAAIGGNNSAARGSNSYALGEYSTASGINSYAFGKEAIAGNGTAGSGFGNYSVVFGLGDSSAASAATYPRVTGTASYGIFMGDQVSVDISASNIMALLGGRFVIDPDTTSAANTNVSTGVQQLELDVEGDIGAINYCDQAGNNCFTPASVTTNRALSAITAAAAGNSINNADYAQVWNWNLSTADNDAFTFTENTASTATGHSSILKAATLASSTATPLRVTNLGNGDSFVVNDETGDADTSPFVIAADGKVGIGTASPSRHLDVNGEIMVSGGSTDWLTTSGSAGCYDGSYRIGTTACMAAATDYRMLITNTGNVGFNVATPLADLHSAGNLLVTGTFGAGNVTPTSGAGTRMMFIPRKAAFRSGYAFGTEWNDASIGNYSFASGNFVMALGTSAAAFGQDSEANATASFAAGNDTGVINTGTAGIAMGNEADVSGAYSMALGLGNAAGTKPRVSGTNSFGIFMGDQQTVDMSAANIMALLGGRLVIDPDTTSAVNTNVSTGVQQLELDVEGDIGAINYCDQAGNNCFTPASVTTNRALSSITAAAADNSINNGDWNQVWNWQLAGAETGFTFSENTASSGGTTGASGNQFILKAETLATSTATPLVVTNLGTANSFRVNDATGDADATPFVIDETGEVGIGTATPGVQLQIHQPTGAFPKIRLTAADVTLPNFSGSASIGDISASNTFGQIRNRMDGGGVQTGGVLIQGFTGSGVNNFFPLHLVGTHGGTAPTTAAVTIGGQKWSGTNNRSALDGATPVLDIENNYATAGSGGLVMRVMGDGKVGIGTPTPDALLDVTGTDAELHLQADGEGVLYVTSASGSANQNAEITARRSRGTLAAPTIVQDDDAIMGLWTDAYDGDTWETLALIQTYIDGTPGDEDMPGRIEFQTQPDGGGSNPEGTTPEMVIKSTGAVGIGLAEPASRFVVAAPSTEVIGAAATITANACGTVKRLSATANRTTNTTDTFTAPTASYAGCCMDVVNVDTVDTITLDSNAKFVTGPGTDLAVGPGKAVRVCSDGTSWYQASTVTSGAAIVLAIDDLTDAFTDYAVENNFIMGRTSAAALAAGAQRNTFIGQGAGATTANSTSTTDSNTAVGYVALSSLTSGDQNTAIGRNTMQNAADASWNTAIGNQALQQTTSGDGNTAVGSVALYSNVAKRESTAIGYAAMMYADSTAVDGVSYNTAVGAYALRGTTTAADNTGAGNTAVGHEALMDNAAGSGNVGVGYAALHNNNSGNSNIALGYQAMNNNVSGNNNVAIGEGALLSNNSRQYNTAVGHRALMNAGSATDGNWSANTAVGALALQGSGTPADNTGEGNTAIGYSALAGYTSGSQNTAMGVNALAATTGGAQNTAIGFESMRDAAGAGSIRNTALGYQSMVGITGGAGNTAIGHQALAAIEDGNYNVAIGEDALEAAESSEGNVAIGHEAGDGNTDGDNNILIGWGADTPGPTDSNHLNLGGTIFGDLQNDRIRIGGSGLVGAGPLIATPPAVEGVAAAAVITANACGTIKQINATGNQTTNTTNTFTAPTAAYAGCCMDVVNVDTVDTITLDQNANFFTGPGTDLALAPGKAVRVCSDGTSWYQAASVTSVASGGNIPLSGLTAAIAANSINNADYAQTWNWQLTTADKDAFTFTENTASTATGHSSILKAATLASSTATPLRVTNLGDGDSLVVNDETGDADTTPFIIKADGKVGVGTASPSQQLEVYGTNAYISLLSNGEGAVTSTAASANWWDNGGFNAARSRGTIASPTAVQSGDSVLTMWGTAYDGNTWETPALMQYFVDGTPGDGDMPGRIEFQTQADGAAVNPEATTPELVIKNNGYVGLSVAAPSALLHVNNNGAGDSFRVDDVNSDATPFVIDTTGEVGIGIAAPDDLLDIGAEAEEGISMQVSTSSHANHNPFLQFMRSRGTMAAPTAVQNNDMLLDFIVWAHDGTDWINGAMITAAVDGTPGTNDMPTRLEFNVQPDGSGTWMGDGASTPELVIKNDGAVGIGIASPASRFVVAAPTTEVVAAAAVITANACGTVKRLSATANRTTDTTDTFTAPTASYAGCCMDVVNVDTVDTITLDQNAKFFTGPGTDLALGPGKGVRVCSDGTSWYQAGGVSSATGSSSALSAITAATGANSINSGDNAQTWNWQLTTADKDAFTFTENAASSATGHSSILKAATLATSTATPLMITNLGAANSLVINDETGDNDTSPFIVKADGKVGIGTTAPETEMHILNPSSFTTLTIGNPSVIGNNVSDGYIKLYGENTGTVYTGTISMQSMNLFLNAPNSVTTQARSTVIRGSTAGNAVLETLILMAEDTDSAASNGIGASMVFNLEDSVNGTYRDAAKIEGVFDDVDDNSKDGSLRFYTMGPNATSGTTTTTERVRIDSSGNVGIGTATPTTGSKLDVYGPIFLNGDANASNGDLYFGGGAWIYGIGTGWDGQNSNLRLNPVGTAGGTADFRDVSIYDGKTVPFAYFQGSTKRFSTGGNDATPDAMLEVIKDSTSPLFMLSSAAANNGDLMIVDTDGDVGIGTTSPSEKLHISGSAETAIRISSATNSALSNSEFEVSRARGTIASPTVVQDDDAIFGIWTEAYDGNSYETMGLIQFEIDGTPGDGDMPGRIEFHTQPAGSVANPENGTPELVIKNNGAVGVGIASPASRFVVAPPTSEVVGAAATITANACGTVKQLTATANRTTNTTDTFTTPTASYAGCCMDVVNVDTVDTITLDQNGNFFTGPGTDLALGPGQGVRVCSDGTDWYQAGGVSSATAGGGGTIDGLTDAYADYTTLNNLIMGRTSAAALTAGAQYNLFIGENAGATSANSTAATDWNVALGHYALPALTSGHYNTALGALTLQANTTGSDNVAIGTLALNTNVTKIQSTAVGYRAMEFADSAAGGAATNNTAVGAFALQGSATAANNTGVGNTAIGHGSLMGNTSGVANSALGYATLTNNTTGNNNIAIGYQALQANTSGSTNVAIGDGTMNTNTTRAYNTAVGYRAMLYASNSGGGEWSGNTALGALALQGSSTAANNSGQYNTAVGYSALTAYTSGTNNTAMGLNALSAVTTGSNNTGIGFAAGDTLTTGTDNILIGYSSDTPANNTTYHLNIGDAIFGDLQNDRVRIGGSGVVSVGPLVATAPATETVAAAAIITANACGTVKRIDATANRTTNTTDTFTTPTAAHGGCCMDVVNVDTVDTITLDQNGNFFTGTGANVALAPGAGVRVCSDGTDWYQASAVSSTAAGTTALSGVIAAAADATINNGANNIVWNWQLSGAEIGHTFGENTASAGGSANQYILAAKTLASSTATPFMITNLGAAASFRVNDETGDADTSPFIIAADGKVGIGTQSPSQLLEVYGTTANISLLSNGEGAVTSSAAASNWWENGGFNASRSRGTIASPTVVQSGDSVLTMWGTAYDGNSWETPALIQYFVDGTPGDGDMPGRIEFQTQADGAAVNPEATTPEMVIKNNGYVGIGIAAPTQKLHVASDGENGIGVRVAGTSAGWNPFNISERSRGTLASPAIVQSGDVLFEWLIRGYDGGAYEDGAYIGVYVDGTPGASDMPGRIEFNTQPDGSGAWMGDGTGTSELVIKSTGNVGINNDAPNVKLDVVGDIEYTGTIADVSDIRLKKDIHPLTERGSMLEKLNQVETYSFTMKQEKTGQVEFGVMAQEIEKIFPELVRTADDEMGTKSVNYVGLIAPMIEAGKELEAQNKALKAEIAALKTRQDEMKQAMNDLAQDMKGLKIHTGYGIGKAEMSLLMILAALGTLGAVGLARRRFGQPRQ